MVFGNNHELLAANVGVNINANPLLSFLNPQNAQSASTPTSSGSQSNYGYTSAQNYALESRQSYAPEPASYYSPVPEPPKICYPKTLYPQMYCPAPTSHQMIHYPPYTSNICSPALAPAPLTHNLCCPPPPPQCYCQFPKCPPMNTPEPTPAPEPVPSCCCPAGPSIIYPQCPSIPQTEIVSCCSVPETNTTYCEPPLQQCLPCNYEIPKVPDQGKLMCIRHYTVKKIKPVYDEYVCKIPVIQNVVRHQPVTTVKTISAIKRKVVMQPEGSICHSHCCETKMAPTVCSNAMLGVPKQVLHHTSKPCIKYRPVIQESVVKIPVKQKVYRPVIVQRIVKVPVKTTVKRNLVETKIEKIQVPCECA